MFSAIAYTLSLWLCARRLKLFNNLSLFVGFFFQNKKYKKTNNDPQNTTHKAKDCD